VDGIVPAAGRGSRLRPLTDDRPKGLVPVAGRPLLDYAFDRLLAAGATRLVVVVGYRGDDVVEHYGDTYEGVQIAYVRQARRLGVADALRVAGERAEGPALVCHGDLVFVAPLEPALRRHRETDAAATLSTTRVDEATARTTGVCEFADGRLVDLVEKPDDPPSLTALVGAYVVDEPFFDACDRIDASERGEYELPDAVSALLDEGRDVETVPVDGEWVNVNDAGDRTRAADLLDRVSFP
jgi:dTDP-glucose pyrophosphorylase